MVQHLLHIQNLVTPEIWYNIRRFRRLISPLGASGSGFGIFQPPPLETEGFSDGNLRNRLGFDHGDLALHCWVVLRRGLR